MTSVHFETIVDLHYENLYRFALSLTRNRDDACDLVQQTFVVFAGRGKQIREKDKTKQWLFTTLYREFAAAYRKSKKLVSLDVVEQPEAVSTHPSAQRKMDQRRIIDLLQELPERYRTVLTLYYLDEHSYQEIADVLGVPIGTVMSRLSRAKEALRELLASHELTQSDTILPFTPRKAVYG